MGRNKPEKKIYIPIFKILKTKPNIMDIVNAKLRPLSALGDKVPQIKEFARNAGIESGVIVAAAGLVFSLITVCIFGATILTLAITVLYPAAKSI